MTRIVGLLILAGMIAGLCAIPVEACPPAAGAYAAPACAVNSYVAPTATYAATTVYAYPVVAIPVLQTITVPVAPAPTVPVQPAPTAAPQRAVPVPQQEEQAYVPPAAAPMTLAVPQQTVVVQRQFYTNYLTAPAAVVVNRSYAYGRSATILTPATTVVLERGVRARERRAPVFVERQRRAAPIRNRVARNRAAKANAGVAPARVVIRR